MKYYLTSSDSRENVIFSYGLKNQVSEQTIEVCNFSTGDRAINRTLCMVFLVGFVIGCLLWLTVLTFRDRVQRRQIEEAKINDQENIFTIRRMVNEIEYLKMMLYGKEEETQKDQAGETGDEDRNES
jgi:hypothetical protein